MKLPTLQPQEIPFDHEESDNHFRPSADKPLVATPAALDLYGDTIPACLSVQYRSNI